MATKKNAERTEAAKAGLALNPYARPYESRENNSSALPKNVMPLSQRNN